MRWPIRRSRATSRPGAEVRPAAAAVGAPERTAPSGEAQRPAPAWLAVPPLKPVLDRRPPLVGAVAHRLPEVSGTRDLLLHHHGLGRGSEPGPAGRVIGLTQARAYAEDRPVAGEAAVPAPESYPEPPLLLARPVQRPALAHPPLTQAVDQYVGEAQPPAEPYHAPGWLKAAATAPFLVPNAAAPTDTGPDDHTLPHDWATASGPVIASWTAPQRPETPPLVAAPEASRPTPRRRRNLGESRRLGLGTPFSREADEPLVLPEPAEPYEHEDEAESSSADEDSEAADNGGLSPPPPSPPRTLLARAAEPAPTTPRSRPQDAPLVHPATEEPPAPAPVPSAPETPRPFAVAAPVYRPADEAIPTVFVAPQVTATPPGVERVPPSVIKAVRQTYGADVSGVPVFRGPEVSAEARSRRARAFSRGGAVFLPAEEGPLDSPSGRAVLGHELVHVLQQRRLGRALPSEHTAQGRALEAEARVAEQLIGGRPAAELTYAQAPLDPGSYAQQVAEELVRQGLAHRDDLGAVHVGPAALDSVDVHASETQRLEGSELTQEQLERIKLDAYALTHKKARGDFVSLDQDTAFQENRELRETLRYEIAKWKDASEEDRINWIFLLNLKGEAIGKARESLSIDKPKIKNRDDIGLPENMTDSLETVQEEARLQIELLKEALGTGGGASLGSSRIPRVPQIIGKDVREAVELLHQVSRSFVVGFARRSSMDPEGTVIEVRPHEGAIVSANAHISVVVSSGPTMSAFGAAAGFGAAAALGRALGLNLDTDAVRFAREKVGLTEEAEPRFGKPPEAAGFEPGGGPAAPAGPGKLPGRRAATGSSVTPAAPRRAAGALGGAAAVAATGATAAGIAAGAPGRPRGAEARLLKMPKVVGLDVREAQATLKEKKIPSTRIDRESMEPAGLVIFADRPEGSILGYDYEFEAGQRKPVQLVVSSGPTLGAMAAGARAGVTSALGRAVGLDLMSQHQRFGLQEESAVLAEQVPVERATGSLPTMPGEPGVEPIPVSSGLEHLSMEELADRLYGHLHSRLSREIRVDRTRIGRSSDHF